MQTLTLIRHGQREDFENPRWREGAERPYDTPLSPRGFCQAADVARVLSTQGVGVLYASPFLRTLQTASVIAETLRLPIRLEPGFCEWLNPAWQDTAPLLPDAAEASRQFPAIDLTYRPLLHPVFPEFDERIEVLARVTQMLQALFERHPAAHVAIVTHGAPLAQSCALMLPGETGIHMEVASMTQITREGTRFRLLYSGIDHLTDPTRSTRRH